MSLLDDVSIVVTPNGYKAGTLYGVLPTYAEGSEEVTYPNFTNSDISQWNMASSRATKSWNASEFMRLTYDLANGSALYSSLGHTLNVVYKVTMRVRGTKADGTTAQGSAFSSIGDNNELGRAISNPALTADWQDYEFYTVPTSSTFRFYLSSATIGDLVDFDSISVKEVTSSDMDVTRATAATRVDEDGLVNYAEIIGSEEVTNGDFTTDTDWTKGTGWTISGGNLNASSPNGTVATSQGVAGLTAGKTYKVSFEVSEITSGYFRLYAYVGASGTFTNIFSSPELESGTYETTFEFGGANKTFRIYGAPSSASALTVGSVSNISVKEQSRDNVPRIDYTGGGCPHILAEPQRTNLLRYSEDFSEWTMNGTSRADSGVSSIGLNYYTITNTGGGFLGIYYQSSGFSHGDTITTSVYVKKGTSDSFTLRYGAGINQNVEFDLDDGTVVSEGTNVVGTIQSMSDGWYRVTSTWTDAAHTFSVADIALYVQSGNVEISGAQCEVGSYATSYIPNFGTSAGVTRNEDIFTRDGIGSLINDSEGTFFLDLAYLSVNTNYPAQSSICLSDGSTDDRVILYTGITAIANRYTVLIKSGGNTIISTGLTVTDITLFNKIAITWKANEYRIYWNGNSHSLNTSETAVPSGLNRLAFDRGSGNANLFYGKVKQLQVYDTALSPTQLAALTS